MAFNMLLSGYIEFENVSASMANVINNAVADNCFANSTAVGNCLTVQTSIYGKLLGFPVAGWGIIAFFFMTVSLGSLAFSLSRGKPIPFEELKHFEGFLMFGFLIALFGSLWFIYLQFFVIGTLCKYCMVIDSLTIISTLVYFGSFIKR
jgi:uncharacterized membrane protein